MEQIGKKLLIPQELVHDINVSYSSRAVRILPYFSTLHSEPCCHERDSVDRVMAYIWAE
jgi:hypothetical protein